MRFIFTKLLSVARPLFAAPLRWLSLFTLSLVATLESPTKASFYVPAFHKAVGCRPSTAGLGGVLFVEWPKGKIVVVKGLPDRAEAVNTLFAESLCKLVGVTHPAVQVLQLTSQKGMDLRRRLELLAEPDSRVDKMRMRILEGESGVALLMEYVAGGDAIIPKYVADADAVVERLGRPAIASALGRVTAVDCALNNWDRLPFGLRSWRADPEGMFADATPGNLDNLVLRRRPGGDDADEPEVVAIDTDMKRSLPNPHTTEEELLREMGEAFRSLIHGNAHGTISNTARRLREGIAKQRPGVVLSDATLKIFQEEFVRGMRVLATTNLEQVRLTAMRRLRLDAGDKAGPLTQKLVARASRILDVFWNEVEAQRGGRSRDGAESKTKTRRKAAGRDEL